MHTSADFRDSPLRKVILLAPPDGDVPAGFQRVRQDPDLHECLLHETQRLRGRLYLADGAVQPWQLASGGRHELPVDLTSWHLLIRGEQDAVVGCARYRQHARSVSFCDLGVAQSALAQTAEWGDALRMSVNNETQRARDHGLNFVEVGGWALHEQFRGTTDALRIALAAYALAESLGGCIGITTATCRNRSSSILRRIGGRSLETGGVEIPPYYDPFYRCDMEILRFDSAAPNPKFTSLFARMQDEITQAQVIQRPANCMLRFDCPNYATQWTATADSALELA